MHENALDGVLRRAAASHSPTCAHRMASTSRLEWNGIHLISPPQRAVGPRQCPPADNSGRAVMLHRRSANAGSAAGIAASRFCGVALVAESRVLTPRIGQVQEEEAGEDGLPRAPAAGHAGQEQVQHAQVPHGGSVHQQGHHLPGGSSEQVVLLTYRRHLASEPGLIPLAAAHAQYSLRNTHSG